MVRLELADLAVSVEVPQGMERALAGKQPGIAVVSFGDTARDGAAVEVAAIELDDVIQDEAAIPELQLALSARPIERRATPVARVNNSLERLLR